MDRPRVLLQLHYRDCCSMAVTTVVAAPPVPASCVPDATSDASGPLDMQSPLTPTTAFIGQAVVPTLSPADVAQWLETHLASCVTSPSSGQSVLQGSGATAGRLPVGCRIKALWHGGGWFDGRVSAVHANGDVDVQYDDGDSEQKLGPGRIQVRTANGALVPVPEFLKAQKNG